MMTVENSSLTILGAFEFFQDASFLLVLVLLVMVVRFMHDHKDYRTKASWVLFLLIHAVFFYSCVFVAREGIVPLENSTLIFTNWSSALRLHSYVVLARLLFYVQGAIREKRGKT